MKRLDKNARRTGIWGGSGSGKSTRMKEIMRTLNRNIVLDPTGDWQYERGFRNYTTLKGLYAGIKANWNNGFRFVLTVDEDKYHLPDLLQRLSRDLFIIQRPYFEGRDDKQIVLAIDEMADFFPNTTLKPEEMAFSKLCRKGRHYGVNIIGASQRLAEVHPSFRGNAQENYFFRQDQAVDIQRALATLGSQYKADILALQPHEYLLKINGTVTHGFNEFLTRRKKP